MTVNYKGCIKTIYQTQFYHNYHKKCTDYVSIDAEMMDLLLKVSLQILN